jgi:hypothetical protein
MAVVLPFTRIGRALRYTFTNCHSGPVTTCAHR